MQKKKVCFYYICVYNIVMPCCLDVLVGAYTSPSWSRMQQQESLFELEMMTIFPTFFFFKSTLHWFPVNFHVNYKTLLMIYKALQYLREILNYYDLSLLLRSQGTRSLSVLTIMRTKAELFFSPSNPPAREQPCN